MLLRRLAGVEYTSFRVVHEQSFQPAFVCGCNCFFHYMMTVSRRVPQAHTSLTPTRDHRNHPTANYSPRCYYHGGRPEYRVVRNRALRSGCSCVPLGSGWSCHGEQVCKEMSVVAHFSRSQDFDCGFANMAESPTDCDTASNDMGLVSTKRLIVNAMARQSANPPPVDSTVNKGMAGHIAPERGADPCDFAGRAVVVSSCVPLICVLLAGVVCNRQFTGFRRVRHQVDFACLLLAWQRPLRQTFPRWISACLLPPVRSNVDRLIAH
jgi:hypothetical protein